MIKYYLKLSVSGKDLVDPGTNHQSWGWINEKKLMNKSLNVRLNFSYVFSHPDWDRDAYHHDLALIRLKQPIVGNATDRSTQKVWTGWTRIYPLGRGGKREDLDNARDIIRCRQLSKLGDLPPVQFSLINVILNTSQLVFLSLQSETPDHL